MWLISSNSLTRHTTRTSLTIQVINSMLCIYLTSTTYISPSPEQNQSTTFAHPSYRYQPIHWSMEPSILHQQPKISATFSFQTTFSFFLSMNSFATVLICSKCQFGSRNNTIKPSLFACLNSSSKSPQNSSFFSPLRPPSLKCMCRHHSHCYNSTITLTFIRLISHTFVNNPFLTHTLTPPFHDTLPRLSTAFI